jgi:hypothetical protein
VRDAGEATAPREIVAPRCEEAVEAIAIVSALAIDPSASLAPAPAAPAPRHEPEATRAAVPQEQIEPPRPEAPARWRGGVGGQAVVSGAFPAFAGGGGIFLDLDLYRAGVWTPSARAFGRYVRSGHVAVQAASAQFDITELGVEGCPVFFRLLGQNGLSPRGLGVRPCASVELGRLRAAGFGAPAAQSARDLWLAVGTLARLEWAPIDAAWIELQGGIAWPMRRTEFHFDPAVHVYSVPAILGFAGAGVGAHFP